MKTSNFKQFIFCVCLTLLFVPSTSHAGVYKWVDANGQTHYSEKKEDADKAKALELKVKSEPISTQATDPLMRNLQEQERQFKTRQGQNQNGNSSRPPVAARPKSLSDGRVDETSDASRCNLARDVLSGAVKHRSGAPIDENDREVAKNDVRAFCH
jgi:hypothetical protein